MIDNLKLYITTGIFVVFWLVKLLTGFYILLIIAEIASFGINSTKSFTGIMYFSIPWIIAWYGSMFYRYF